MSQTLLQLLCLFFISLPRQRKSQPQECFAQPHLTAHQKFASIPQQMQHPAKLKQTDTRLLLFPHLSYSELISPALNFQVAVWDAFPVGSEMYTRQKASVITPLYKHRQLSRCTSVSNQADTLPMARLCLTSPCL